MDLIGHLRIWEQRGSYINRDGHSGPENRAGRERCFHLSGKGKKDPKGDPEVIRADIHSTGPSLVSEASERPPPLQFQGAGRPLPHTSEERPPRSPEGAEGAELLPGASGRCCCHPGGSGEQSTQQRGFFSSRKL